MLRKDPLPPTCGQCKFRDTMAFNDNKGSDRLPVCGHKGGPDRTGAPGFIVHNQPPPQWCPRRYGIFNTMISNLWGGGAIKKPTYLKMGSPVEESQASQNDGSFLVNDRRDPDRQALLDELRKEKARREEAERIAEEERALREASQEKGLKTENQLRRIQWEQSLTEEDKKAIEESKQRRLQAQNRNLVAKALIEKTAQEMTAQDLAPAKSSDSEGKGGVQ